MKTNKLLLMGILAAGLAACTSDENAASSNSNKDLNTYAGLIVSLQQSTMTRAGEVTQAQSDNVGRASENAIARVGLVSSLTSKYWDSYNATKPASPAYNDFWKVTDGLYTVSAFPASAGAQRIALMLNYPSDAILPVEIETSTLCKSWNSDTDNAIVDIGKLARENEFTMSSVRGHHTVIDNVTADDVNAQATANPAKNVFQFDVERLVSQAIVTKAATLPSLTVDGSNSRVNVDLDNLDYAVINGATSIYFWADNAGERTITDVNGDGSQFKYKGLKSAIHEYLGTATSHWRDAKVQERGTAHLIRLGNYAPFDPVYLGSIHNAADRAMERTSKNNQLGGYKAIPVFASAQMADESQPMVNSRGIYFLENSVGQASYTQENKNVGFYRLAYAKVYGVVTPVKVYGIEWVDNGGGGIQRSPSNNIVEYTIASQADKDAMPEATVAEKIAKAQTYVIGTTFYRGQDDDFLYADPLAAMVGFTLHKTWTSDVEKTANAQPYWTYMDARCAWRALLNRQTGSNGPDDITKAVQSANTRRNNIYWLEIEQFQQIGMPYDPSDPNDPNLPQAHKDNPTDPDPSDPDNPDVEVQHTYMKVISHVLNWNVVKRSAVFY